MSICSKYYIYQIPISLWLNKVVPRLRFLTVPCTLYVLLEYQKEYMMKSYYLGGGKTGIARRISWDEPCLTLTCSPAQKQTERCHPEETRPFTIREYARIQTFPDNWHFCGSLLNQYKQIGNAVPVNFAKELGISVINFLNK